MIELEPNDTSDTLAVPARAFDGESIRITVDVWRMVTQQHQVEITVPSRFAPLVDHKATCTEEREAMLMEIEELINDDVWKEATEQTATRWAFEDVDGCGWEVVTNEGIVSSRG